jgi:drug/metabolite transporter (DMT)-like permease
VLGIVWALRFLPTALASVVLLGQPVGTAILGWALLGEAIGPLQALGGGAVLAGIALCARAR